MEFWKMNGAGNDFIVIDNRTARLGRDALRDLAIKLCHRRFGIGADGFMVVEEARQGGDFAMLFLNSDGSLGEMCGNGARCICRFGHDMGLAGDTPRIETTAGPVTGWRLEEDIINILSFPTYAHDGVFETYL